MAVKSLTARLADLHSERVRTWPPAQLQGNIDTRRHLVETANHAGFIKVGDLVPDFTLPEVDGETLRLSTLLRDGSVVLVFFRFAGCPACNIAIPYYQEALWPGLRQRGAQLVALSPQIPERLVEIKRRHGLEFLVASDVDNGLARNFGVTFQPDEAAQAATLAKGGAAISDTTGASTWELPMPAVIVIDQDRRAQFVDISPDWLVRTEAEPVLAAVDALSQASAAA
jgi:peroxiredoxin